MLLNVSIVYLNVLILNQGIVDWPLRSLYRQALLFINLLNNATILVIFSMNKKSASNNMQTFQYLVIYITDIKPGIFNWSLITKNHRIANTELQALNSFNKQKIITVTINILLQDFLYRNRVDWVKSTNSPIFSMISDCMYPYVQVYLLKPWNIFEWQFWG